MSEKINKPKLPRRTREHIIASQSQNYVEKFFIDKGHTVDRPSDDYGTDLLVNTYDERGYPEVGEIRLQLKATDRMRPSKDGSYFTIQIDVKHYHLWKHQLMPMFLILYDAQKRVGYWFYLQDYLKTREPRKNARKLTLRVPTANLLSDLVVDYMRERKAEVNNQIEGVLDHVG